MAAPGCGRTLPASQPTRSHSVTRSPPAPLSQRSHPLPPEIVSAPGPPTIRSAPGDPASTSDPAPPMIESAPLKPSSRSLPPLPRRTSSPGPPDCTARAVGALAKGPRLACDRARIPPAALRRHRLDPRPVRDHPGERTWIDPQLDAVRLPRGVVGEQLDQVVRGTKRGPTLPRIRSPWSSPSARSPHPAGTVRAPASRDVRAAAATDVRARNMRISERPRPR